MWSVEPLLLVHLSRLLLATWYLFILCKLTTTKQHPFVSAKRGNTGISMTKNVQLKMMLSHFHITSANTLSRIGNMQYIFTWNLFIHRCDKVCKIFPGWGNRYGNGVLYSVHLGEYHKSRVHNWQLVIICVDAIISPNLCTIWTVWALRFDVCEFAVGVLLWVQFEYFLRCASSISWVRVKYTKVKPVWFTHIFDFWFCDIPLTVHTLTQTQWMNEWTNEWVSEWVFECAYNTSLSGYGREYSTIKPTLNSSISNNNNILFCIKKVNNTPLAFRLQMHV